MDAGAAWEQTRAELDDTLASVARGLDGLDERLSRHRFMDVHGAAWRHVHLMLNSS